jgi:hypothetical protein
MRKIWSRGHAVVATVRLPIGRTSVGSIPELCLCMQQGCSEAVEVDDSGSTSQQPHREPLRSHASVRPTCGLDARGVASRRICIAHGAVKVGSLPYKCRWLSHAMLQRWHDVDNKRMHGACIYLIDARAWEARIYLRDGLILVPAWSGRVGKSPDVGNEHPQQHRVFFNCQQRLFVCITHCRLAFGALSSRRSDCYSYPCCSFLPF